MQVTRWASAGIAAAHSVTAALAVGVVLLLHGAPTGSRGVADQLVQAPGLVALVWAYVALILGLLIGIRPRRAPEHGGRRPGRSLTLALHRQLNLVVLALTLLHALVFALATPGGSLVTAFVPGAPDPRSFGFGLGILALYLAVLVGPTYYLRDRIGRRTWLVVHQLAAITYALALWHAVGLGPDLRMTGPLHSAMWLLQLPLLALIAIRLLRPRRRSDELSAERRRGRYTGRRHVVVRAAVTVGLGATSVIVLQQALLAATGR